MSNDNLSDSSSARDVPSSPNLYRVLDVPPRMTRWRMANDAFATIGEMLSLQIVSNLLVTPYILLGNKLLPPFRIRKGNKKSFSIGKRNERTARVKPDAVMQNYFYNGEQASKTFPKIQTTTAVFCLSITGSPAVTITSYCRHPRGCEASARN